MRSNLTSRMIAVSLAGLFLTGALATGAHAADKDKGTATTAPAPGPLGDLSSFRDMAIDTLKIVRGGDLAAAKKRITDLETAWDNAEEKLKAKDNQKWTAIDKSIDRALKELRSSPPVAKDCVESLEKLINKFDSISPR